MTRGGLNHGVREAAEANFLLKEPYEACEERRSMRLTQARSQKLVAPPLPRITW